MPTKKQLHELPRALDLSDIPRVEKVPCDRDQREHVVAALTKCVRCCRRKKRKLVMIITYNEELHWVECKACGKQGAPALTSEGAVRNWNNGKEKA